MERILTIGEIENLGVAELNEMLSIEGTERIEQIGITIEQFLNEFKDNAILTGKEDNEDFMSINDFIGYLEGMEEQLGNVETFGEKQADTSNELVVSESQNNQLATDFRGLNNNASKPEIITNITDRKQLFNLGKKVDKLLNECEGQEITVDKILIKKYQKTIDEPVVNENTGEIISDTTTKTSMSVVIVDENGISYATGSKTFGYSLLNAIYEFDGDIKGLKIRIIKTLRAGNKNKSLDFELV